MLTKVKLKSKSKQKLLRIRKESQSAIVRDRAHAVLMRDEEFTIADTAKALSRSDKFVREAVKKYRSGEIEDLNFNCNNCSKLSDGKKKEIIKIIQDKCPKDLKEFKFTTQFWSTDILKQVIKKKYGIEYKNTQSYYDLFKKAGFSFKKPKIKDFRQDPEKIEEFKGALKKSSKTTKIRFSW